MFISFLFHEFFECLGMRRSVNNFIFWWSPSWKSWKAIRGAWLWVKVQHFLCAPINCHDELEPIYWRNLPCIFGLFFRPKFQGISQQNMAKHMVRLRTSILGSRNSHWLYILYIPVSKCFIPHISLVFYPTNILYIYIHLFMFVVIRNYMTLQSHQT